MIGPIGVTYEQAESNFDFMLELTDSQKVCWKISTPEGKSVMMVPVNEIPPIPDSIQQQVEEFQKQFLETNASRNS